MNRRGFLGAMGAAGILSSATRATAASSTLPNIIIILADDLGYGDLGCYGSKIPTPNLDRMASEGVMLRQFCAPSAVCSPSRAAMLTGRYGVRVGVPQVLQPWDRTGLRSDEMTFAEMVKPLGYRTACIGKWHVGTQREMMPTRRGFDEYFGLLFSNDQGSPLVRGSDVVESPVDLEALIGRYDDEAVAFLERNRENPFLLYLPMMAPHLPLVASARYRGKSPLGLYGDVVEELDASVGKVLDTLKRLELDQNTLVIFTSDNGPWFQGSTGPHRGRKGDTFDGGMRVPFLARWPGRIPPGKTVDGFASGLDLLPTIARITGATLPDRALDGTDIFPMLTGDAAELEHPLFLYFDDYNLQAVRLGKWKLHLTRYNSPPFVTPPEGGRVNLRLINPELYNLEFDPGESYSVADENPQVVADLRARVDRMLGSMPVEVRTAWTQTQNRPTEAVDAGAWPRLKN